VQLTSATLLTDFNREIRANAGDQVEIDYFDARLATAGSQRTVTLAMPVRAPSAGGHGPFDGFVGGAGVPQADFFGRQDYANLTITDNDRNVDPTAIDTLRATLEVFAISSAGQASFPLKTVPVTLFETGPDTDVFAARLKFGPYVGIPPKGLTVLDLGTAAGTQYVVHGLYEDRARPACTADVLPGCMPTGAHQPSTFDSRIVMTARYRPATPGSLSVTPTTLEGLGQILTVRVSDSDRDGRVLQERVGLGNGVGNHQVRTVNVPASGSQIVYVETAPGSKVFRAWRHVNAFTIGQALEEYRIDANGVITFGDCQIAGSACTVPTTGGKIPLAGVEIRADYRQQNVRNDVYVRLESYLVDPDQPFDPARDARPMAVACGTSANPNCHDRLDLRILELTTTAGQFDANVPLAIGAAALNDLALQLPPGDPTRVDRSVIVVTYFDYAYIENLRPRANAGTFQQLDCSPNHPADVDNEPGAPFSQVMPGQPAVDGDCQFPFTVRDLVQATVAFTESTTAQLAVHSGNQRLANGVLDAAKGPRAVFGTQPLGIRVADADLNRDPLKSELATVVLKTDSNPLGVEVSLAETSANSGVFAARVRLGPGGVIAANHGDRYTVSYTDQHRESGGSGVVSLPAVPEDATDYRWFQASSGAVSLTRSVYIGTDMPASVSGYSVPRIRAVDMDRNRNPAALDQVKVRYAHAALTGNVLTEAGARALYAVDNCRTPAASGNEATLTETGVSTGVFEGTFPYPAANKPLHGETLLFTYCDPHDEAGREGPARSGPLARIG
ncbi:MAG TPA: hypothetical protein VM841_11260, partial [Actinomycetota bacterium]|nr:hypothetical protein [Actinomycetota bacterium]